MEQLLVYTMLDWQYEVTQFSPLHSGAVAIKSGAAPQWKEKRENGQNREPPRLNIKSGECVCMRVSFRLCTVSRVLSATPAGPILCKQPNLEGHRGGHTPTHSISPQLDICPLGHKHRNPSKDAEQQLSKWIISRRHVNQKATFIPGCHHFDKGHLNWKLRLATLSVFLPSSPTLIYFSFPNQFKEFQTDDVTNLTTATGVTLPTYTLKEIAFSLRCTWIKRLKCFLWIRSWMNWSRFQSGRGSGSHFLLARQSKVKKQPYLVTVWHNLWSQLWWQLLLWQEARWFKPRTTNGFLFTE